MKAKTTWSTCLTTVYRNIKFKSSILVKPNCQQWEKLFKKIEHFHGKYSKLQNQVSNTNKIFMDDRSQCTDILFSNHQQINIEKNSLENEALTWSASLINMDMMPGKSAQTWECLHDASEWYAKDHVCSYLKRKQKL